MMMATAIVLRQPTRTIKTTTVTFIMTIKSIILSLLSIRTTSNNRDIMVKGGIMTNRERLLS